MHNFDMFSRVQSIGAVPDPTAQSVLDFDAPKSVNLFFKFLIADFDTDFACGARFFYVGLYSGPLDRGRDYSKLILYPV